MSLIVATDSNLDKNRKCGEIMQKKCHCHSDSEHADNMAVVLGGTGVGAGGVERVGRRLVMPYCSQRTRVGMP